MPGRMEHREESIVRYKLILVPERNVRTCSPRGTIPEWVDVSQDVLYEVIADVGDDKRITMSRMMYEQVEVVDPGGV